MDLSQEILTELRRLNRSVEQLLCLQKLKEMKDTHAAGSDLGFSAGPRMEGQGLPSYVPEPPRTAGRNPLASRFPAGSLHSNDEDSSRDAFNRQGASKGASHAAD